jgi:hypothetical protein
LNDIELKEIIRECDLNIGPLVCTLNSIPGLSTNSSCEGHADPKAGQADYGSFYVDFDVEENRLGWQALDIVSRSIEAFKDQYDEHIELTLWYDGGLRWNLRGEYEDEEKSSIERFNTILMVQIMDIMITRYAAKHDIKKEA